MRVTDKPAFFQLLADVMAIHGKTLSDGLLAIWWEAMKSFDLADIRRAMNLHVMNPDAGQYPVKPADIIRYLHGSTGTQALAAWAKVERAIRQVGRYSTVIFDDPRIHAIIAEMGGWPRLCQVTEEELPFKAREFERRYQGYALEPPTTYPRALIGLIEAENSRNGYAAGPPVLIGDPHQARRCYHGGGEGPVTIHRLRSPRALLAAVPSPPVSSTADSEVPDDQP